MKILSETEIRTLISREEAFSAVRDAFRALADGRVTMPFPTELDFPHQEADLHVKGAFVDGLPLFSFKVVCGFYDNARRGIPVTSGAILVFDADTGALRALLFDNGFLTNLRTAAAGALTVDLLARPNADRVAMIGAGTQARFQLAALLEVRRPGLVAVYSRTREHTERYAHEMRVEHGIEVETVDTPEKACAGAQIVVTTTTAREPILRGEWLAPGTHIVAVGSDLPAKRELADDVLASADVVVADALEQCLRAGEIRHAVEAGHLDPARVLELGALASGRAVGRTSERQITVADLTGVGAQDVAVASVVATNAALRDVGFEFAMDR